MVTTPAHQGLPRATLPNSATVSARQPPQRRFLLLHSLPVQVSSSLPPLKGQAIPIPLHVASFLTVLLCALDVLAFFYSRYLTPLLFRCGSESVLPATHLAIHHIVYIA